MNKDENNLKLVSCFDSGESSVIKIDLNSFQIENII